MGFNVRPINGNPPRETGTALWCSPRIPLPTHPLMSVTDPAAVTEGTRARTPATADMSVTLHFNTHKHKLSPTHTHTLSLRSSCRPDRESSSPPPSFLLPSDGSSGRTESAAHRRSLIGRFHTVNAPLGPSTRAVETSEFLLLGVSNSFLLPPRVTRLQGG